MPSEMTSCPRVQGSLARMVCHFLRPESFLWRAGGCASACSSRGLVQLHCSTSLTLTSDPSPCFSERSAVISELPLIRPLIPPKFSRIQQESCCLWGSGQRINALIRSTRCATQSSTHVIKHFLLNLRASCGRSKTSRKHRVSPPRACAGRAAPRG